MAETDFLRQLPGSEAAFKRRVAWLERLHVDLPLTVLLLLLCGYGLVVLYSALDGNAEALRAQAVRLVVAFAAMFVVAQIPPAVYQRWARPLYGLGLALVAAVLVFGISVKGAQRWIDLPGLPSFQPSELMKLVVPLMLAAWLAERSLPPRPRSVLTALGLLGAPAILVVLQPDLGTAILLAGSGLAVVLLAGLSWRWLVGAATAAMIAAPGVWFYGMQPYQKQRVLTLFDPERDPLGAGWNIIQSTTAIGSGGVMGKGLFNGTQSHLNFLPEGHTDFILSVLGEELGFLGILVLLGLYLLILLRGLWIARQAQTTFATLLAGGLTITFFTYVFVNIAMVSGLAPVVGVPLPLVSYGGTSALTILAGFGMLMSIHTHRRWLMA